MKELTNFLIENWYNIVIIVAIIVVIISRIKRFIGLKEEAQIECIKKWLLGAVIEAEAELGSGTGALKLQSVYDAFVERFPSIAVTIPFEQFSDWVDEAICEMKIMLEHNKTIKEIVVGEEDAK